MRKPTQDEVKAYIAVVNLIKPPKTHKGMLRIVAKYFHCSSKEIEAILKA